MASFDENGKYIKTNWKAGDKITSTKLNKIEESIEAVNDNDISRHVEADTRLDALEAKDVAHDKELTNIKKTIADNKAAAELGDYDINSRMTFLENELNEGIEEVHNVASTAQANMTAQVNQGKADMEAMVAEVEADLEGLHAKDEELSKQIYSRAYKPQFIVSTYWNETTDTNGNYMMYNEAKVLNDIDNWLYHKVDGITIIIHIGVNLSSNSLFIGADLDILMRYVDLAINNGLKIHAIKIHKQINQEHIDLIPDFNTQYADQINIISDRFKNITDRIICFNEFNYIYNNVSNKNFVLSLIDNLKIKGFKVGISTQGSEEMYVMDEDIKESLDILGINHYRYISTKKDRTTYSDSFNSWNNSTVLKTMKHLKEKYQNKEVVMTESGVQDYWEALAKPEHFNWSDTSSTSGKAQATYLYGLLSNTNVDYINSVWWWYNFSTKEGDTSKLTRHILGGIKYE